MSTNHIDQESLLGYITRTIDDSQRELIDSHTRECPTCRVHLAEQHDVQRRIADEISSAINQASPTNRLSFSAIEGQLSKKRSSWVFWRRLEVSAPVALSFVGLLLSALGLWRIFSAGAIFQPGQPLSTFPTIACFLFMLASVEEFERSFWIRPRFMITILVAAILWVGTAVIGILNILVVRDLTILGVVFFGGNAAEAGPFVILSVMGAALLYIGVVIGGAEYHYTHIGQPGSWKLFSITLLGQLFLLILPYLLL